MNETNQPGLALDDVVKSFTQAGRQLDVLQGVNLAIAPGDLSVVPASIWLSLLYLCAASSILAYAAWYWALGQGDIAHTGLFQFFQPVVGLVLAAVMLGEVLTWPLLLATILILGGVMLAQGNARPQSNPEAT